MFAIRVNGTFLKLDSESSISLEINNPLLAQDFLPGDYSFPFTIPFDPINDQVFNLARVINNTAVFEQDYDAELFIAGMHYIDGVINVTRTDAKYNITFASQVAKLKKAVDKKLSQIDLGGDRTIGATTQDVVDHAKACCLADPLDYDYTFPPIYHPAFYGNANTDFQGIINKYDTVAEAFPQNVVGYTENFYALSPQPYLHYILKQIFAEGGYVLRGQFMDDLEMKQLIVQNNWAIDLKVKKYYTYALLSAGFTDASSPLVAGYSADQLIFDNDSTGDASDTDGAYNTGNGRYVAATDGYHSFDFLFKYTPSVTATINLTIKKNGAGGLLNVNEGANGGVANELLLSHIVYLTAGDYITFHYSLEISMGVSAPMDILAGTSLTANNISYSDLNQFARVINLQNHVPDMKATDFLLAVFGLGIKPRFETGTNVVYLDFEKSTFTSNLLNDLTPYARAGFQIDREKHRGFTFDFDWPSEDAFVEDNFVPTTKESLGNFPSELDFPSAESNTILTLQNLNQIWEAFFNGTIYTWQYFTDNHYPLTVGEGEDEYKPKLSTLLMNKNGEFDDYALIPQIDQKGNSAYFANGTKRSSALRLLFYRGMQLTDIGNDYPMASSSNFDYAGTQIGNYALMWDGDYGLYEKLKRQFTQFIMNAKMVTYTLDIPPAKLLELNVYQKQTIDRVNYIIGRIRINITPTQIEPAVAELYTI